MTIMNRAVTGLLLTAILLVATSCQMGRSKYMSEEQQEQLETAYDSLQSAYKTLITTYKIRADSLPDELRLLYSQMQQMHRQMGLNHRQMMRMHMDRHMQGNKMMAKSMGMHMQSHMTGEWYSQMMGMHEQMGTMHETRGQQTMAKMNRRLSREYQNMMHMVPGLDDPSEVPFNEQGDPSLLNGKKLYTQNCASCHGNSGKGIGNAFPPLVDTNWITGDSSIPVRILLNGLRGEIMVNGERYRGRMPSFKARLSAAEMASILNYLRAESEDDLPRISQETIINIGKTYSNRIRPWQADELTGQ